MDKLSYDIEELLSDDKKLEQIALNGKRKAEKEHTWKKRVDKILEIEGLFSLYN